MKSVEESTPSAAMKDRLIEVAGEIFGEKGFKSATVREITTQAGANVAAVNYYFRDKEELYAAVLRHAVQCSIRNDPAINESLSPEEQLHQFIVEKLNHMLDPRRPKWHGQLLSREMSSPTASLDLLVSELIQPRLACFFRIVTSIAARDLPEKKLALLLLSVLSQCSYYRQSGALIDRLFPDLMKSPTAIPDIARHITTFSVAGIRACGLSDSQDHGDDN